MFWTLYGVSVSAGVLTILFSFILLYTNKITLDQAPKSKPPGEGEAFMAKILDLITISSNAPAISLFAIGMALIITPLLLCPKIEKKYSIRGIVTKEDGLPSVDIGVLTKYPPSIVSTDGEISDVEVSPNKDGDLPTLYFVNPQYDVKCVDLNDPNKAEISNKYIRLKEKVVLQRHRYGSER